MIENEKEKICQMIDHTLLKPYASSSDLKQLCSEAREYHFKMVAINSYPVKMCKEFLKGSDVHVGAAIGFPLGQTTIECKCFETNEAINHGADEIDYVINISKLKDGDLDYIRKEMRSIKNLCEPKGIILKVILETCYLTKEEIISVCEIAKEIKPNFVKTSTGFGAEGATAENVKLMKQVVGDSVEVKAAGGIRSLDKMKAMIEAGATRIGTSSGIKIIKELQERNYENN
ncbi:deoxyribose-phosphate aldolase [Catenisphaera adipataccumulans]|jgi:deoxyribose-phosphate aldolase|uniref:Deoxyribose-phosphate aldolase n=1 Tax=Catenisphaera adipataccumulans TaxID=700500 RepID=A0A7W8CY79_9FIRM|nr:deoxyribose-phosphate aldolase [Catenisphaera adipataccumulans]MBB5183793.1 deoxyribose-phosphate aldolase [Catenisphaera adipataccumulans]